MKVQFASLSRWTKSKAFENYTQFILSTIASFHFCFFYVESCFFAFGKWCGDKYFHSSEWWLEFTEARRGEKFKRLFSLCSWLLKSKFRSETKNIVQKSGEGKQFYISIQFNGARKSTPCNIYPRRYNQEKYSRKYNLP